MSNRLKSTMALGTALLVSVAAADASAETAHIFWKDLRPATQAAAENAGLPMIATSVGGVPEIFPAGSPALARPDAGEIAARMEKFVADPAAWQALMPTTGALKGKFGVDVMARAIEREYFRVLES